MIEKLDKKILIIGGSGYFGSALTRSLGSQIVLRTYYNNKVEDGIFFDLNSSKISEVLKKFPNIKKVIISAGIVEFATINLDPDKAEFYNVICVKKIIDELADLNLKPIYISSDHVFDGIMGNYIESDKTNPKFIYGIQKDIIEKYIIKKFINFQILRLSKIFDSDLKGNTLIANWINKLDLNEDIYCANDNIFTPIHLNDVCEISKRIINNNSTGIYHLNSEKGINRKDMLKEVLNIYSQFKNYSGKIYYKSLNEFLGAENLPLNISMNPQKAISESKFKQKSFNDWVKIIVKQRFCRICNSSKIHKVIEFKPTPPGDLFLSEKYMNLSVEKYPLDLALCEDCGYLHLSYMLDPYISYSNYIYETKVTVGLDEHYKNFVNEIILYSGIPKNSFLVDLGSNDGTILNAFKKCGMRVLGVEPNEFIANKANKNHLETINGYFNSKIAKNIIDKYGKALIVTANYMYANIDDVLEFTDNVRKILDKKGLFVIQTGYHPEQMKINMFDYIYHEHFSYFSIRVLNEIFKRNRLELIYVEKFSAKGGSVKVIAQHEGQSRPVDDSVKLFIRNEKDLGIHNKSTYINFADKILLHKKKILEYLKQIKSKGHSIVGYGASHSTTTLLHHYEFGEYLEYIIDDNPIKQGLYSPGYHLRVYPKEKIYEKFPSNIIILAWQHKDTIINNNKDYINKGGEFIIPLPVLKVINNEKKYYN